MAYTQPTPTSILQERRPTPVRVLSGAPATADVSLPSAAAGAEVLSFDGFSRLRLGLILDGGSTPRATVSINQWVPGATSWIEIDSQSSKASGYSWEVNCPPGTYYIFISALSGSPTGVCVTAQAAERF